MVKVVLIAVEDVAAIQICRTLGPNSHRTEYRNHDVVMSQLSRTTLVFFAGKAADYLPLLRRTRTELPALPFIGVTRFPDTKARLGALEAGATDYISPPIEPRELNWMMQYALPRFRAVAAF